MSLRNEGPEAHAVRNDINQPANKLKFQFLHTDHGITDAQWEYLQYFLSAKDPQGFFIEQFYFPEDLGTLPCGLHGPVMGDAPVPRSEVEMVIRGGEDTPFRWPDPVCQRPTRPVRYGQIIGIRKSDDEIQVFTAYGGALAPQNPEDPSTAQPEVAKTFWGEHALSAGQ